MALLIRRIPPTKTFDLPAGTFKCRLSEVRPANKMTQLGLQENIRLIFVVVVPGYENQICCAGRTFKLDLNPGSALRNFLEIWLGSDWFAERSNQDLDFATLIDTEGDIQLSHFFGKNYEKPHVNIDNVFPIGTKEYRLEEAQQIAPKFKEVKKAA